MVVLLVVAFPLMNRSTQNVSQISHIRLVKNIFMTFLLTAPRLVDSEDG